MAYTIAEVMIQLEEENKMYKQDIIRLKEQLLKLQNENKTLKKILLD